MPETSTSINLSRGSIELLISALATNGWTSKRREITSAGYLVETLEPLVESRPVYAGELSNGTPVSQTDFNKFRTAVKTWERESVEVTMTDPQFQSCVSCLKHFSDEKRVPANIAGASLLTAFKLSE